MRYGFWTPVFGGWLRNVPDEHMEATWDYTRRLCQRGNTIAQARMSVCGVRLSFERLPQLFDG